MRIRRITVEFEREDRGPERFPEPAHAQRAVFEDGAWTSDGPLHSRFLPALHEVWQVLRRALKGE